MSGERSPPPSTKEFNEMKLGHTRAAIKQYVREYQLAYGIRLRYPDHAFKLLLARVRPVRTNRPRPDKLVMYRSDSWILYARENIIVRVQRDSQG